MFILRYNCTVATCAEVGFVVHTMSVDIGEYTAGLLKDANDLIQGDRDDKNGW